MKTLNEMAVKLQESIIKQQDDAHNSSTLNVNKYNNLKIRMSTKYHYPHISVSIGISEAIFNIEDCTKTDGGLGPDERYVRKWMGTSTIAADLKEIYAALSDLIKAEDVAKEISQEGEADEVKRDAPRKKTAFKKILEGGLPMMNSDSPIEEVSKSEQMISLSEEVHNRTVHSHTEKNNDTGMETVDNVKKDLKDFLKSMFRRK